MLPDPSADNPLEPCPETPNCTRSSMEVHAPISNVKTAVLEVLNDMKAESVETGENDIIHAVFRIKIFGYRDDMHIALHEKKGNQEQDKDKNEDEDHSVIIVHVRSASRVGNSDLGVNKRRVKRFYKRLKRKG